MSETTNNNNNHHDYNNRSHIHRISDASASTLYSLNAGRDAFKNTPLTDMSRNDTEELRRQQFAIRSFTQSIEMDLPPAPELPPTLDIDHYGYPIQDSGGDNFSENGMTSSSTADTIVEVIKNSEGEEIDPTLGETQKYIMQVPAPGLTEQEMEMHKSLMKHEDAGDDEDDSEVKTINDTVSARKISSPLPPPTTRRRQSKDREHDPLRREFSNAAKQRPRPTTPTQKCTLESYVSEQEKAAAAVPKSTEKIKINIPRKSLKGRQPEDFYQSMSSQMPPQTRQNRSNSNYGSDYDDDVDIIEQNPEYKDKAPKAPVVHRRTSVEWEAFDQSVDRTPMADTKEGPAPSSTPPTTPGKSPLNGHEKIDDFKKAAEKVEEINLKKQTADAFAEELFGKNDDDWANQAGTIIPIHQPSTDDPIFGVDQSEEPDIEEIPEVSLSHRGSRRESRRESHQDIKHEGEGEHSKLAGEEKPQHAEHTETEHATEEQPTTDDTTTEGTDQTAAAATNEQYYDYSAYGYDPNYANYDHSQTGQEQAAYDPNAYNYDQSAYNYDQNGAYDYSQQYGYDQTTGAYNQEYPGYDTTAYDYGTLDPNTAPIDTTAYDYGTQDPNTATDTTAYDYGTQDPNTGAAAATTDYYAQGTEGQTAAADYSGYDPNATTYNPFAAAAAAAAEDSAVGGYDYSAQAATSAYGDTSTTYTDPTTAQAPDYTYDQNTGSYYDTSQYGGGYQYGDDTTDYSQYGYSADTTQTTDAPYETPAQPSVTQFTQPLFQSAKVHDPYAWDSHDTPAAAAPAAPPSRPAPPIARAAETPTETTSEETQARRAPPPRPGAPPSEAAKPSRPPPPSPQPARPPPPQAKAAPPPGKPKQESEEEEEDAWAKFNKMTEMVSNVVKSTKEKIEEMGEKSAADDIHDESYLSNVGGSQGMMTPAVMRQMQQMEEEKKKAKADKKKAKHMKRPQSPEFSAKQEMDMDKAAAELAARIAATRAHDLGDWKPPNHGDVTSPQENTARAAPPPPPPPSAAAPLPSKAVASAEKVEDTKNEDKPEETASEEKTEEEQPQKTEIPSNWAGFGESGDFANAALPSSDSDFFTLHLKEVPPAATDDPFAPPKPIDPFAPQNGGDDFDPFDIKPAEDIVAQAKERANLIAQREDDQDNIDYLHPSSNGSSPTPEGGSPISARPPGFEDEFKPAGEDEPTPLYDEDDSVPLTEFPKPFTGEGWDLMIRYPPKKKIMADRYWKPCFVRIKQNMLYIYNSKTDDRPMQEIMLQPTYSLSDATLQAYDIYGKIHTVKLQYVQYKERIGIRSGQIARLVEGHVTKYGMPIEHAAQVTILSKFGCLNADELTTFINAIEDFLFTSKISREIVPQYKQDEVQIHCYDEYQAYVDKDGFVSNQQARVRMFCLAFVSGSPILEIGLNDRRRQGKEIVRRKDILPMYTERWIRFENLDFHCTVDKKSFEEEQVVRLSPPDGTFIEICRFRVRPPKNREKPLIVKSLMKIAGSKIEIRIDAMVAAHQQRAKGTNESIRTIPCEDIVIRFPIPEAWIYIFREERHWGVGSVHSKTRRPGKVKNLKDKILGAVQQTDNTLIEVAIGEAKYEHVFRALVWRIPRLPEKHHAAYKVHLLKCRFDLSSFDLMPETFLPTCDVEFTMPLATISNTVVRSVSVEQHEDSDRVEKFVRYVAKCKYQIEVDYVQCNDLDNDAVFDAHVVDPEAVMSKQPEQHKPLFNPEDVDKQHGGYGIEFSESEMGGAPRPRNDSSSDEEPEKRPVPIIEINMKGYGY